MTVSTLGQTPEDYVPGSYGINLTAAIDFGPINLQGMFILRWRAMLFLTSESSSLVISSFEPLASDEQAYNAIFAPEYNV